VSIQSRSEHILELAQELLDDIELNRADAEHLLLKATRLARWVGSDEIKQWLKYEMKGYNSSNEVSLKYVGLTGRWTDKEKGYAYWGPLAQQEAAIEAEKAKLASMSTPDTRGSYRAISDISQMMNRASSTIARLGGIRSRVLSHLHSFVSDVYYEKVFDQLTDSIFEKYQKEIDSLISEICGEVLEKIPAVMDRLTEGDTESVSQALTTCRRILESFADAVFPPEDGTYELGGNQLSLDASKHQNRINIFVSKSTESSSRRKRLRQNLANLFDRVSTGVHNDVTPEEARALFFNTYMVIGEILHLNSSGNRV